jgi:hypothetical protein
MRRDGGELMLSIGMLAAGDEDYFIAVAADRPGVSHPDEYFTSPAERPGVWVGGGSMSLGLSGPVEPADLRAVLDGVHPATTAPLTSAAAAARRTRPGMYLTFSTPKGVSLIGLLATTSPPPPSTGRMMARSPTPSATSSAGPLRPPGPCGHDPGSDGWVRGRRLRPHHIPGR